jgi:Beta-1,3-glucanase
MRATAGGPGPDLLDPSDPNHDVYFDWYELTYQYRVIPFGGNTTQVDMFALPLVVRLRQRSSGYDRVTGIQLTFPQAAVGQQRRDGFRSVRRECRLRLGLDRPRLHHRLPGTGPGGTGDPTLRSELIPQ